MPLDGARTLGSYQLLSQLAVGGMAEIYVARTHGVGGFEKLVALKLIHPNYSADPDFVQMLVDEAKLSVQLQHANIVQTFDLGRVDDQYYIAMELIDGVDLYKLLRRASEHDIDFPFEVAAFIGAEVCAGLDYAHRRRDARGRPLQIVHRDVSPQNVLCSYDGEIKIVDFGIAKAAISGQKTAAGVIKGKYYYMSPEQAWGDPIDARTDIFSTGILLYEMIVGQMLYLEEDLEKLLDVVRKANIPPPSTKRMGVPRELEALVMRALQKRADDRWPTAGEFGQALTQFLHGFSPDFNRARVAAFVREVMGDDPTKARRDPRVATAHVPSALSSVEVPRDGNSLLFKLQDLRQSPRAAEPPPRRADVPTSVRGAPGDFEENEATIVDASGDTLLARVDTDSDATRPAGPAVRRSGGGQVPSGKFDLGPDDPAADADLEVPTLAGDDDDLPTGARPLPRTYATRPIAAPDVDPDDESTPDTPPVSPLPSALPGVRESRPTPLGVRTRAMRQPNAPRAPLPPSGPPRVPMENAPRAPMGAPASPMENAPTTPFDDGSTRERVRPEPRRTPPPLASFADERLPDDATVAGRGRGHTGPQPRIDPNPNGPNAPAAPPPLAAAPQGPTVMLPPSQNPVARFDGPRPPSRPGFEEPTRIPPAMPPPLDSGRFVSGFDGDVLTFPSPLGEPEPLRKRSGRGLWVIGLVAAALITVAVVVYTFSGSGESRGTLTIVSSPSGAEVRIDGTPGSSATPLTLADVDRRLPHHVRVSRSGYDVWESDVRFPPGEREVRVQAVLVPTVGSVEISSTPPGAEAIVNGRIRGITPVTVGDLPPNDDVVIELRLRGYKVAHKTASWAGKRKLAVSIPLEKAK